MRPNMSGALAASCAKSLRLTMSEVLAIARTGPKRYRTYPIDKRNGGKRIICQPSRELKTLQYFLIESVLSKLPVHGAATAYVPGMSIRDNASRHAGGRVIYKLDFRGFFPSISAGDWAQYVQKELAWPGEDISFSQNVMFWGVGGVSPICLSIGAPTSPYLSNILMFKFDETLQYLCDEIGVVYTRYADDLTFSTSSQMDVHSIRDFVRRAINSGFVKRLELNEEKTTLVSKATSRRVTGLIITNDGAVSLGREKKREISVMIDHVRRGVFPAASMSKLSGWLAYANDVEPSFVRRLCSKYSEELVMRILRGNMAG